MRTKAKPKNVFDGDNIAQNHPSTHSGACESFIKICLDVVHQDCPNLESFEMLERTLRLALRSARKSHQALKYLA
jgi:hypothetical protein